MESRGWRVAVLGLLGLVWVLTVVLPAYPVVFPADDSPRLLGADSYHHLRHTWFSVEHFPKVLRWDTGSRYPKGRRSESTGLFQIALASVSLVAGLGKPDFALATAVLAWSPVVLSLLVLFLSWFLSRRLLPDGKALLVPWVLCCAPGALGGYSLLGFADHHVVEVLLLALSAHGVNELLREPTPSRALLWALPPLIFQFTWPAASLYLLLLGLAWLAGSLELFFRGPFPNVRGLQRCVALYGLSQLLLYLLLTRLFPSFVLLLRNDGPAIIGYLALGLGLPAVLEALRLVKGERRGLGAGLLCLGGVMVLGLVLSPVGRVLTAQLMRPEASVIGEHRPVSVGLYWAQFGVFGVLAIVGFAGLVRARRGWVLASLWASTTLLWLVSRDFSYLPPLFVALMAANALARVSSLKLRLPLLLLASLLPWTGWLGVQPPFRNTITIKEQGVLIDSGWRQALAWLKDSTPEQEVDALVRAWENEDYHYPEGSYGVYAPWDFGHQILCLGRRPVVWNQTYSHRAAKWWLEEDEEQAYTRMQDRCESGEEIRYLMVDNRTVADFFPAKISAAGKEISDYREAGPKLRWKDREYPLLVMNERYHRTMAVRLQLEDGNELSHFRLLYETPQKSLVTHLAVPEMIAGEPVLRGQVRALLPESEAEEKAFERLAQPGQTATTSRGYLYAGRLNSHVKIYQVVRGAHLVGQTTPGSLVAASLLLECGDRQILYENSTRADETGYYRLTVPYPTRNLNSTTEVRAREPYQVQSAEGLTQVDVDEVQVEKGAEVTVK